MDDESWRTLRICFERRWNRCSATVNRTHFVWYLSLCFISGIMCIVMVRGMQLLFDIFNCERKTQITSNCRKKPQNTSNCGRKSQNTPVISLSCALLSQLHKFHQHKIDHFFLTKSNRKQQSPQLRNAALRKAATTRQYSDIAQLIRMHLNEVPSRHPTKWKWMNERAAAVVWTVSRTRARANERVFVVGGFVFVLDADVRGKLKCHVRFRRNVYTKCVTIYKNESHSPPSTRECEQRVLIMSARTHTRIQVRP